MSRLASVCHIDYARAINLVAEIAVPGVGNDLIGIGRLHRLGGGDDAEATLLVADRWQNCGLGTALLAALIEVAAGEGLKALMIEHTREHRPRCPARALRLRHHQERRPGHPRRIAAAPRRLRASGGGGRDAQHPEPPP